MTVTEDIVETIEDSQRHDLRRVLDLCIEEMDTLQQYPMYKYPKFKLSRSFIKKYVGKNRKLLSNPVRETQAGKIYPTVSQLHSEFFGGHQVDEIIHGLKMPDDRSFKDEYAKELHDKLTFIDRQGPPKTPRHPDYGQFPLGHHRWVDEQGNDMWKSERADAKDWVKKHPEVKKWHSRGKE